MKNDFVLPLVLWYEKNHRKLPWRESKDPYHIWLSEIMLQQTRVEAVKAYYARFLDLLPSIEDLASASEETILKLWEGLGYYSRVRNMQKAAKYVMEHFGGQLPADHDALLKLPGIGEYTAGAIASFAFDLPYAAVDGNVLRVMSRLTGDTRDIALASTKKEWQSYLEDEILTAENASVFNQAVMELGAMICLPNGAPKCDICPVRAFCKAYKNEMQMIFPVKSVKKPRRIENLYVFFIIWQNKIAIRKRDEKGLLASLWEFPNCPSNTNMMEALFRLGITEAEFIQLSPQKHIFTHVEWHMDCYGVVVKKRDETDGILWVTKEELSEQYALPSAFRPIAEEGFRYMKR